AQHIEVRSGIRVILEVDGETHEWVTTASTVGDVLEDAGVSLYLGDVVEPPVDSTVTDGMTIRVERSFPVTITIDDTQIETRAAGDTVADALAAADIIL